LIIALSSVRAFGHGFDLSVISTPGGPKLVGINNGDPTGEDRLFAEYWLASAPDDYLAIHGGVIMTSGFAGNVSLSLRFFGPLWYSDGGPATIVGGSESVAGTSFDGLDPIGNVTIDGSSPPGEIMDVTGLSDHSIGWTLTPFPVAAGSYGFGYQATGSQQSGDVTQEFLASDFLVVVLSTPGFTGSANGTVAQSRQEIYNAILNVPEPSTIVLAGVGAAGLAALSLSRRQRSHR
jgi:hypothetical protein